MFAGSLEPGFRGGFTWRPTIGDSMWFKSAMALPWDLTSRIPKPSAPTTVLFERELRAAWEEQFKGLEALLQEVSVGRPSAPTEPDVRWAMRTDAFDGAMAAISDLVPNLWAVSSTLRDLSADALERELEGEDWWLRHEVLVRRAWIEFHRDLLSAGRSVGYPFAGRVAERGTRSRGRDREFFTLVLLGHWVAACEGRQLLLSSVGETPDFNCREAGIALGVEATEATPESSARRQVLEDRLVARLEGVAQEFGILLSVECSGDLSLFSGQGDAMETSLRAAITEGDPNRLSFSSGETRCSIEVNAGKSPAVLLSDPRGITGSEIVLDNGAALSCLVSSVERKLGGPTPLRPCFLVIYPNFLSEANLRDVLDRAARQWNLDVSSHFDEVWVVQEQAAARIV